MLQSMIPFPYGTKVRLSKYGHEKGGTLLICDAEHVVDRQVAVGGVLAYRLRLFDCGGLRAEKPVPHDWLELVP
jgi:hypothetical protein